MKGIPPFPVAAHLIAPPQWRCIDFISDLHLQAGLPKTTQALQHYLRSTPADAVLILGDLFEAWVGDDMRQQPYEAHCQAMLAEAGKRLHLAIMVGNRDFLMGADMLAACHAHALADPTVLQAWGQSYLLIHGDELCLSDTAYLRFRADVRQTAWQARFLSQPLPARLAIARQMREASEAHQHNAMAAQGQWADVDESAAQAWMQASNTQQLIHGHTHRPQSGPFAGGVRHVLSDWDLDHGPHGRAQILRLTPDGLLRLDWSAQA